MNAEEFIFELVSKIGLDNWVSVIALCLFGAIFFAKHCSNFIVPSYEGILLKKDEETKRNVLMSIILFIVLGGANFACAYENNYLVGLLFLTAAVLLIIAWGIFHELEIDNEWCEMLLYYFFIAFLSLGFSSFSQVSGNKYAWSIVCVISLVETCLIMLRMSDNTGKKTKIAIKVDGKDWYVYKRVDEKYFLCGDNADVNGAERTILFDMDMIVSNKIEFNVIKEEPENKPAKNGMSLIHRLLRYNWWVLGLLLIVNTIQSISLKVDYVAFTVFVVSLILALEDCYWNIFKNIKGVWKVIILFLIAIYEVLIIVRTFKLDILDFGMPYVQNIITALSVLILIGVLLIRVITVKLEKEE